MQYTLRNFKVNSIDSTCIDFATSLKASYIYDDTKNGIQDLLEPNNM